MTEPTSKSTPKYQAAASDGHGTAARGPKHPRARFSIITPSFPKPGRNTFTFGNLFQATGQISNPEEFKSMTVEVIVPDATQPDGVQTIQGNPVQLPTAGDAHYAFSFAGFPTQDLFNQPMTLSVLVKGKDDSTSQRDFPFILASSTPPVVSSPPQNSPQASRTFVITYSQPMAPSAFLSGAYTLLKSDDQTTITPGVGAAPVGTGQTQVVITLPNSAAIPSGQMYFLRFGPDVKNQDNIPLAGGDLGFFLSPGA